MRFLMAKVQIQDMADTLRQLKHYYQYPMTVPFYGFLADLTDKRNPEAARNRFMQGEMLYWSGRKAEAVMQWERIEKEGYAEYPGYISLRNSWLLAGYTELEREDQVKELERLRELRREFEAFYEAQNTGANAGGGREQQN